MSRRLTHLHRHFSGGGGIPVVAHVRAPSLCACSPRKTSRPFLRAAVTTVPSSSQRRSELKTRTLRAGGRTMRNPANDKMHLGFQSRLFLLKRRTEWTLGLGGGGAEVAVRRREEEGKRSRPSLLILKLLLLLLLLFGRPKGDDRGRKSRRLPRVYHKLRNGKKSNRKTCPQACERAHEARRCVERFLCVPCWARDVANVAFFRALDLWCRSLPGVFDNYCCVTYRQAYVAACVHSR